jgi:hypothetical protein
MNDGTTPLSTIHDPLVAKLTEFLVSIGLPVALAALPERTFLPGIAVHSGVLTIDESNLLYPGDLLHEAGHLAMLPPGQRTQAVGHLGDDGGLEMAALAWSYAAAMHLGVPPEVVFHEAGYKGGSCALLDNFAAGRYIGVPMLEWAGLTAGEKRAQALGILPYPSMLRWLRED